MKSHNAAAGPTALLLLLLLLSLFACDEREQGGAASMQGPGVNDAVIARLATAQCEREQGCNHVGLQKEFPSLEACNARMT